MCKPRAFGWRAPFQGIPEFPPEDAAHLREIE